MANEEHLEILKQGFRVWNKWREDNPDTQPDLKGANLRGVSLEGAYSTGGANLRNADIRNTDLSDANLKEANLTNADLRDANLNNADLTSTNLRSADLTGANLKGTTLLNTRFQNTRLNGANFENAVISFSSFSGVDLSAALGLEKVEIMAPSSFDIDTLYISGGKIPVEFLRRCGVPDDFITFIPSHFGVQQAIQFYSCFISYSTKDDEFARRLYSRMRDEKLRVWFAPEEMKGGKLLHEQIEEAIQFHDRLLIILSEESMKSEWVKREIRNARRTEKRENRRKLFPIRLVDYESIENWKGFEGDGAEDLAFELGKFYIPDFSNWKDHDSFEQEFAKLMRDLKPEERQ